MTTTLLPMKVSPYFTLYLSYLALNGPPAGSHHSTWHITSEASQDLATNSGDCAFAQILKQYSIFWYQHLPGAHLSLKTCFVPSCLFYTLTSTASALSLLFVCFHCSVAFALHFAKLVFKYVPQINLTAYLRPSAVLPGSCQTQSDSTFKTDSM